MKEQCLVIALVFIFAGDKIRGQSTTDVFSEEQTTQFLDIEASFSESAFNAIEATQTLSYELNDTSQSAVGTATSSVIMTDPPSETLPSATSVVSSEDSNTPMMSAWVGQDWASSTGPTNTGNNAACSASTAFTAGTASWVVADSEMSSSYGPGTGTDTSTSDPPVECFVGICDDDACLLQLTASSNATCTSTACKLSRFRNTTTTEYTMSCSATSCTRTVINSDTVENCCSTGLCNTNKNLLNSAALPDSMAVMLLTTLTALMLRLLS